jgi:broad specificity phosphatase PhoE
MTNFFLVRHGETDWNLAGRIQGATDIPLNDTGRDQARATGIKMQGRKWDVIVSSPLSRAFETASIIASLIGLPEPTPIDGLVERNYGEAEGMTGPELESVYPSDSPVPGREERSDVKVRVLAALHELARDYPGKNVVVVAHGGVIRSVLHSTTGTAFFGERITNGSVHSFHHSDDGLQLVQFNDPLELLTDDITLPDFEDQQPLEKRD